MKRKPSSDLCHLSSPFLQSFSASCLLTAVITITFSIWDLWFTKVYGTYPYSKKLLSQFLLQLQSSVCLSCFEHLAFISKEHVWILLCFCLFVLVLGPHLVMLRMYSSFDDHESHLAVLIGLYVVPEIHLDQLHVR